MRKSHLFALTGIAALVAIVASPLFGPSVQASVVTGVDTYALTLASSPAEQVSYDAH